MIGATLSTGVAEELARVIGALIDAPGAAAPVADAPAPELIVRLSIAGSEEIGRAHV